MKNQFVPGSFLGLLMLSSLAAGTVQDVRADQQLVYSVKQHSVRTARSVKTVQSGKGLKFEAQSPDKEKDKPVVEDKNYTQTITLGENYLMSEEAGQKSIFDFSKKCMYTLSEKEKKYSRIDLHAPLYFRVMEYKNREFLGKVLKKAGADASINMDDAFMIQSLFGIDNPGGGDKIKAEEKADGSTTRFIYKGVESASVTPSKQVIEAPFKKCYSRALAQLFKIHPSIRTALLSMNVPQQFKYSYEDAGAKQSLEYELRESRSLPPSTPLPPGDYKLASREELQPVFDALAKLGISQSAPEKDKVCQNMDALAGEHKYLDAFLTLLEYSLTTGNQMTPEMRKLKDNLQNDPECQKFLADFSPKHSADDFKKAVASLESIDRAKLKKAHIIDIMRANDYEALKDPLKARGLFISVLLKQPSITGVYHDLGMNYLGSYDVFKAWECFQTADKIAPGFPMMEPIHQMTADMESRFPDFF